LPNLFSLCGILLVISSLITILWSGVRCVRTLHLLQLDSYSNQRLLKWLWAQPFGRLLDYRSGLLIIGLIGACFLSERLGVSRAACILLGGWVVGGAMVLLTGRKYEQKKPLVYTGRAKRIVVVAMLICVVVAGAFGGYASKTLAEGAPVSEYSASLIALLGALVTIQGAALVLIIANIVLIPVQRIINHGFIRSAQRKLREVSPVVIGVAGSYGKTSTKYILQTILAERFQVLKTPQSYNTLMGLCRVINEQLQPQHEVFIAEMGAYRRGDVRELAELVAPKIGIITSIGPEHFERFKSMENIEATNYELIEALPHDGAAVFNNDINNCRKLADATKKVKVLRYGLDLSQPGLNIWAEDIRTGAKGLSFSLVTANGARAQTTTILLGRHNVLNILGAACVALEAGLTLEEIARAIPKLEQVPHRLQLVPGSGGVTVIDDSYNSNPFGADEALNVLQKFEGGKRILVTPGMVELGTLEDKENEDLGAKAAGVCDYVFLVGAKQTQAIRRGLEREKFPQDRVLVVRSLAEVTQELGKIVKAGDVVLFENDLPDLYAEP
jgi:UDP-N-acetylmuramoyl-tripeptide--D-alanyl-D-alanine ligase